MASKPRINSSHALISELSSRSSHVANMNLLAQVKDTPLDGEPFNLANDPNDLSAVASWTDKAIDGGGLLPKDAETMIRTLIDQRNFYGAYCELGTYGWLATQGIEYKTQISLNGAQVLKTNGCTIDGYFPIIDAYFDVKAMGFQEYVTEIFREKIESKLTGFIVNIDGAMDVSVKDIEQQFGNISSLVKALQNNSSASIPALGWTLSISNKSGLTTSTRTLNPYRLAQENRFYPFKTAGQFTQKNQFFMIFSYAGKFNQSLSLNFSGSTDVVLRSMARRVFLEHVNDSTAASKYDSSVPQGYSLGKVSQLLSAILFINLDSDDAQLFLNPRATHLLTQHHIQELFDFSPPTSLLIDDFAYDDY